MSMIGARSRRIDNVRGDPHCIRLSAEDAPLALIGTTGGLSLGGRRGRAETADSAPADRQMRRCRRHRLAQRRIA
jgi:hypothetical protein